TEGGVGRVVVVLVHPHTTGLDSTAGTVDGVLVAGPHTGAETVVGVVGDLDGLIEIGEGGHGEHRSEDLLTEDPHAIGAAEDGRLDVVAVVQTVDLVDLAAGEGFRTLVGADLEVA